MSNRTVMEQGAGGPSFCWHCGRQLQRAPGRGLGLFYYRTLVDRDGNTHRVHGDCVAAAVGDGVKLVTPNASGKPTTEAAKPL